MVLKINKKAALGQFFFAVFRKVSAKYVKDLKFLLTLLIILPLVCEKKVAFVKKLDTI